MNEGILSVNQYYDIEKECEFRGEKYSVRNNGAILRHPKEGRRRKLDSEWTFGRKDPISEYMILGQVRVHHVVATAFIGECPGSLKEYVIDHIDNNKCNNRPENLRWCTRLENTLENEITRAKIELICGSIEAWIADPTLLRGHESEDNNFVWMRTVSPEQARTAHESWLAWARKPLEERKGKGGKTGKWIYHSKPSNRIIKKGEYGDDGFGDRWGGLEEMGQKSRDGQFQFHIEDFMEEMAEKDYSESITPTARQVDWNTPEKFNCCPLEISGTPMEDYISNLEKGKVYETNRYGTSIVLDFAMLENDGEKTIFVVVKLNGNPAKDYAMSHIQFKDGYFYHYSDGTFFEEAGVMKAFTEAQGKVWEGEGSIDNYM